jgi:hypothetical protein
MRIWLRWDTTHGTTAMPTGPGKTEASWPNTVTAMGSVF